MAGPSTPGKSTQDLARDFFTPEARRALEDAELSEISDGEDANNSAVGTPTTKTGAPNLTPFGVPIPAPKGPSEDQKWTLLKKYWIGTAVFAAWVPDRNWRVSISS